MNKPIVKICGLMRPEDVQMCMRHGTDVLGFIVDYPNPVSWNLTVPEAKELMASVSAETETCVVTGGTIEQVYAVAEQLRPTYVQFHWESTPTDTARLVEQLKPLDVKLIQIIFPYTPDLEQAAIDFYHAGVFALLLDPRTPNHAEHGGTADLAVWQKVQSAVPCPVLLAGGITPENVADLVSGSDVWMIDLMTGVESAPGVKEEEKVEALFRALRTAD
ncbi:MAG: phosphoribosylanthranilate isomerase [Clostridiales bacterium]|nr:phosphoribosylanthranilate isomerase [Clostridiales bacterium]